MRANAGPFLAWHRRQLHPPPRPPIGTGPALAASRALAIVLVPAARRRQQRCMALDVSWDKPAAEWEALFLRMAASAAEGGSEELAPAGEEC